MNHFGVHSQRVVVIDEPEYTASYHVATLPGGEEMTFIHMDIYYFSPGILKKLHSQWKLWREAVPVIFYAMADEPSPTWVKFIRHFGFKHLSTVECTDGRSRPIFVNLPP